MPSPRKFVFLIVLLGLTLINIETFARENGSLTIGEQEEEFQEIQFEWVEVEPSYVIPKEVGRGYELMPYSERRAEWGSLVGFSAHFVTPVNYQPDQDIGTFEDVYGSSVSPMFMIEYTNKRNYGWGSLGADVGVGILSAASSSVVDTNLTLIFVELGGVISFDNLGNEPYYVPYVGGGGYIAAYKEVQGSTSFNGTTQVAPYALAGIAIQLDRIDKDAALESYLEAGIQNTFFFIEGRKYFQSTGQIDPNFETEFYATAGFKMEL